MEKSQKKEIILPYDGYFTEEDIGMTYDGQEMKRKIFVRPFWSWQTFFGISGRMGR